MKILPRLGPGTVATIAAGFAGLFGVLVLTETGGPEFQVWLTDVGEVFPPLLAGVFGAMVAFRFGLSTRLGRTTLLAAAGFLAWAIGEIAWSVIEIGFGEDPFPSVADIGFLAFYPLVGAAIVSVLLHAPRAWQQRFALHLAPVSALSAIGVAAYLQPLASATDADMATTWLSIAYPALDIVLLTMVVGVTIVLRSSNSNIGAFWIVAGLFTLTLADFWFSVQMLTTGDLASGWPDVLWFGGFTLGAVGFGLVFRNMRSASFASTTQDSQTILNGRVYSVVESRPLQAHRLAGKLARSGHPVVLLTGSPPAIAVQAGLPESAILLVTDAPGFPRSISPTKLSTIADIIAKEFSAARGTFVVIDCIDRLLLHNDLDSVMRLGMRIGDLAALKQCGLIISYDPRWADQRFEALLEKTTERLITDAISVPTNEAQLEKARNRAPIKPDPAPTISVRLGDGRTGPEPRPL